MPQVNKHQPLHHYQWGNACKAWVLVDTEMLSVKQEYMPPHTAEVFHYHQMAQQFFFIIKGTATMEVEGEVHVVMAGKGFHVLPGEIHRIANHSEESLEFFVSSQPSTNNDRYNIG
ncbi:MAG TPA: cupin domain-containing protein [Agriterribacter sp.]|nr:cupin domain-containing protein [Agriterribacter sp.]